MQPDLLQKPQTQEPPTDHSEHPAIMKYTGYNSNPESSGRRRPCNAKKDTKLSKAKAVTKTLSLTEI